MNIELSYENMLLLISEYTGFTLEFIMGKINDADRMCYEYYEALGKKTPETEREYYNYKPLLMAYTRWHWRVSLNARLAIADKLEGRVLDYGCGVATQSLIAALKKPQKVDIDLYDTSTLCTGFMNFIIEKYDIKNMRVTEPHDKYDIIQCFDVLEHLDDPKAKLAELIFMVKPEGKILCRAPFYHKADPSHKHSDYKVEDLFKELNFTNFEVMDV